MSVQLMLNISLEKQPYRWPYTKTLAIGSVVLTWISQNIVNTATKTIK